MPCKTNFYELQMDLAIVREEQRHRREICQRKLSPGYGSLNSASPLAGWFPPCMSQYLPGRPPTRICMSGSSRGSLIWSFTAIAADGALFITRLGCCIIPYDIIYLLTPLYIVPALNSSQIILMWVSHLFLAEILIIQASVLHTT